MYLNTKGGAKFVLTAIPAILMLTVTIWSVIIKQADFIKDFRNNWLLVLVAAALFILAVWMTIETIAVFLRAKPQTQVPS
jgi:hypothetical protein